METPQHSEPETDAADLGMNLGEQPIAAVLAGRHLKPHDLVAASKGRITHKMVARACKGRRLTRNTQALVCDALNAACGGAYTAADLFNYTPRSRNR